MPLKTPLYDAHLESGAKMVDFAGWSMPIHYGSQVEEHHAVRRGVGLFDVSHMTVVDLNGPRAGDFLRGLLANDVARLKTPGKALYSCMLNEQGGVLDDLIVYYMEDQWYRMVVNAATRDKDLAWIRERARAHEVEVLERDDLAMLALQGPDAPAHLSDVFAPADAQAIAALEPFHAIHCGGDRFIGRTGYTGEDGFELIVPQSDAMQTWNALIAAGVTPVGLGARDTLRLEAGMNLYGADMDEKTSPLESGLAWTVAWEPQDRQFIGRQALETQRREGPARKLVGLVLADKGVLRNHQPVVEGDEVIGEVTSGSFSPTLGRSIAFARVQRKASKSCQVDVRGRHLTAHIVKPPFVRKGQSCLPDDL